MKIHKINRIKNIANFVLILLFLPLFFNNLYSQHWIINETTEYFKDKFIDDFGFVNNNLWVRYSPYLFKYENNKCVRYFLNNPSNGHIEKFIDTTNYGSFYPDEMKIIGNKIWLLGENQFIMIFNDTIHLLEFGLPDKKIKYLTSIDNKGDLYILTQKYINENYNEVDYKLFYSNGYNDFKELDVPILNFREIDEFLIYNENKIFSGGYKNCDNISKRRIEIFDKKNTYIKYIDCDSINIYLDQYYFYDNNVFLLNRSKAFSKDKFSCLLRIDSNVNVNLHTIPYELSKTCYFFIVNKDDIYFSDSFGFYKYNLLNNDFLQIPELVDRSVINQTAIRNLVIHNNIIYGCYTNDIQGCGLISFHGLYLYKLE